MRLIATAPYLQLVLIVSSAGGDKIVGLGEQVGRNHRASARRRGTPRFVQDSAAFLQCKSPQLSASNDRVRNIVLAAHWANNAHDLNCGRDVFCIGTADETFHALDSAGSKRVEGTYRSGPCPVWIKVRNPASIAMQRERSETFEQVIPGTWAPVEIVVGPGHGACAGANYD
jgi:hypothetical protein